jgi:hypothetical protein
MHTERIKKIAVIEIKNSIIKFEQLKARVVSFRIKERKKVGEIIR